MDDFLTRSCRKIAEWSDGQFGKDRTPESLVAHLCREVVELADAPYDREEYAGCATLLFDAARLAGISPHDLVQAMLDKLEVCKTRQWGEPDSEGVIEHLDKEVPSDA